MPKYVATARGYDGVKLREIGEVFTYEGVQGRWMKPIEEVRKEAAEVRKAEAESKPKKGKTVVKEDQKQDAPSVI